VSLLISTSASVIRTHPGNAAPARTPTAAASVLSEGHRPVRPQRHGPRLGRDLSSTTDPANARASRSRSKRSDHYCCDNRPNPPRLTATGHAASGGSPTEMTRSRTKLSSRLTNARSSGKFGGCGRFSESPGWRWSSRADGAYRPLRKAPKVTGACSRQTAKRLVQTLPIASRLYTPDDGGLGQSICMDFTADHRTDVVLSAWTAMDHGAHYWAAFQSLQGQRWRRVAFYSDCCGHEHPRYGGTGISLQKQGKLILVSEPIYAPTDPLCCPSRGTRARIWGWRRGQLRIITS
jgi:hypothetical protein